MKISMTVMIIFTTLFCVLPYLWFIILGKNNPNKIEKQINDVVKGEKLIVTIKEQWNNNFIGLDESQNILIFMKLLNEQYSYLKIELKQLKSCQIIRKTKEFKKGKEIQSELMSLHLELTMETSEEPIIILNFYDMQEGFSEDLEQKRAEKWKTLIEQNKLKITPHKKAA